MSDHREAIAEVLHHEGWPVKDGWTLTPATCETCARSLHLADALLGSDVLAQIRAEARAEALREAADAADSVGHHWSGAPALAFFALAGDLRDCAEGSV